MIQTDTGCSAVAVLLRQEAGEARQAALEAALAEAAAALEEERTISLGATTASEAQAAQVCTSGCTPHILPHDPISASACCDSG